MAADLPRTIEPADSGAGASTGADAHGAVHVHIASSRFYWGVFAALICLTIATVKVSYFDFGAANIVLALVIATLKASLVAAFFMHLRHDNLFNTIAFLAAFVFLGVFILLTYDDTGYRGQVDNDYGGKIDPRTGLGAAGGEPATSATADSVAGDKVPGAVVGRKE